MWCRNVKKQTYKAVLVCRKFFLMRTKKVYFFLFHAPQLIQIRKFQKLKYCIYMKPSELHFRPLCVVESALLNFVLQ